jgi:hypothetical protein
VLKLLVLGSILLVFGLAVPGWVLAVLVPDGSPEVGSRAQAPSFAVADTSGNGIDGLIQGSPTMGVAGHDGSAFSFLKGGSWVQVPPAPALSPGERDFLLSAWVFFEDVPGTDESYDILRKGESYTVEGNLHLEVVDPGSVRCTVGDSGGNEVRVTNADVDVTDGAWHFIACVRTGRVLSAVADGILKSKEVELGAIVNTWPLIIGPKHGWEDRSEGRVDGVRVRVSDKPGRPTASVADPRLAFQELRRQPPDGAWDLDDNGLTSSEE